MADFNDLSPGDRIMDEFYKNYPDLDPHSIDRHCVASILESVLKEFAYQPAFYGNAVVDAADIAFVIEELKEREYSCGDCADADLVRSWESK